MSTLDIRNNEEGEINKIIYGTDCHLEKCPDSSSCFLLEDHHGNVSEVYFNELPDLIKALNRAILLWGN